MLWPQEMQLTFMAFSLGFSCCRVVWEGVGNVPNGGCHRQILWGFPEPASFCSRPTSRFAIARQHVVRYRNRALRPQHSQSPRCIAEQSLGLSHLHPALIQTVRRSAGRLAAGTETFNVAIRLYLIAALDSGHGISPALFRMYTSALVYCRVQYLSLKPLLP